MKKILLAFACLPLLTACVIYIGDEEGSQEVRRVLELPASDLTTLIARTGAGHLAVIGEAGRTTVEVQAKINYRHEDDIELWLERSGENARLEAGRRDYSYGDEPFINLTVMVPETFNLSLDDGSGHIDIFDVQGDIKITDGSGHLEIRGGHNVSIFDGSGHITVTNASGNLDIKDGSGHISVKTIDGAVTIDDGAGNIEVAQVGALTIVESGSGSLSIRNVQGSMTAQ